MATYINFWGGPGTGKSTAAMRLFGELKRRGYSAEFIPEYAKYVAYRQTYNEFKDQLSIFAKQYNHELVVENAGVNFIICESPSAMVMSYIKDDNDFMTHNVKNALCTLIRQARQAQVYNHTVIDVVLRREFDLKNEGRYQDELAASAQHIDVLNLIEAFAVDASTAGAQTTHTAANDLKLVIDALIKTSKLPAEAKDWEFLKEVI